MARRDSRSAPHAAQSGKSVSPSSALQNRVASAGDISSDAFKAATTSSLSELVSWPSIHDGLSVICATTSLVRKVLTREQSAWQSFVTNS